MSQADSSPSTNGNSRTASTGSESSQNSGVSPVLESTECGSAKGHEANSEAASEEDVAAVIEIDSEAPSTQAASTGSSDDSTVAKAVEPRSAPKQKGSRARDAAESIVLGFPAKILGEFFSVGDNVTAVVGDLEISSGGNVNRTLIVKGTLTIRENCRITGKLKALKDVIVCADSYINGDIVAGGDVFIGRRSIVNGSIVATGFVMMGGDAVVERGLRSSSGVSRLSSDIQITIDTENVFAPAER